MKYVLIQNLKVINGKAYDSFGVFPSEVGANSKLSLSSSPFFDAHGRYKQMAVKICKN